MTAQDSPESLPEPVQDAPEADTGWVTLAEAAKASGMSVSGLRKLYREGRIESRVGPGPTGERRYVPLEAVLAHKSRHALPTGPAVEQRVAVLEAELAARAQEAEERPAPVPEGYALVPVALAERLGYLLDVATAYAEAGERAGRAEATAEQYHARIEEYRERVAALEEQLVAAQARRPWWRRG